MLFEFGETLNSYFTSDDLRHIGYVYRMFHGEANLIPLSFYTVWLQDASTEIFYRPLVEMSFALDYLFSGANPFGYHLSNFFYSYFGAIFLFFVGKRLAQKFGIERARLIGYVSAFLFAVNPLHCEVTTWIIGRVDGLSTMFYLSAFYLFMRVHDKISQKPKFELCASLVFFSFGLLSKEMTATLPLVVFLYCFLSNSEGVISSKIKTSIAASMPYFLVLTVYFLVRLISTGTLGGGYVGSVGEVMSSTFFDRVLQPAHLWKIACPFNEEFIPRDGIIAFLFRMIYAVFGVLVIARMSLSPLRNNHLRLFLFLIGWMCLQLIPLYQVFMLTETLQGGRLLYLSTAVLSILFAVLLIPESERETKNKQAKYQAVLYSGLGLSMAFVALFAWVGRINNQCWEIAGNQVKALREEVTNIVSTMPKEKKLLIAFLPQQVRGAHMFYSYYLIRALLMPPLSAQNLTDRVVVLEPRFYTHDHLIPGGILKRKLSEKSLYDVVYWNTDLSKMVSIKPSSEQMIATTFPQLHLEKLAGTVVTQASSPVPFNTDQVQFVDVDIKVNQPDAAGRKEPGTLVLQFGDKLVGSATLSDKVLAKYNPGVEFQTVSFTVNEKARWFLLQKASKLKIYAGIGSPPVEVLAARLSSGENLVPLVSADSKTLKACVDGVSRPIEYPLKFNFNASNVKGAHSVLFEITRPLTTFQSEHFTYRDRSPSKKSLKTWIVNSTIGSTILERRAFPQNACYQLRVFAVSSNGQVLGTSSDPIYLGIKDRPAGEEPQAENISF